LINILQLNISNKNSKIMKKTLFTTILLLFVLFQGFSQDYATLAKQAYKVYEDKEYAKSVEIFEQAFKLDKPKSSDLYNAACSASLATQTDKAFDFLGQAIDAGYSNLGHLKSDTDLGSLYKDIRWKEIIAKIEKKQADELAKLKFPKLIKVLDSLVIPDQAIRNRHTELRKQGFSEDSTIMKNLRTEWKMIDSLNIIEVKKIFRLYGFLGFEEVGKKGSNNFWLLIQHGDKDPKFQEEVLSEMKKHIERKNANGTDYAYLIDRVNVNMGKPQIYGTQMRRNKETGITTPIDLFEPEKVNKRRAEVGLGTIEEYIGVMNSHYKGSLKKKVEEKSQ
jgi:tetratricopeptide (TPR) repeat protein